MELKRRNITIPSWYKRQTLLNLIEHDNRRATARGTLRGGNAYQSRDAHAPSLDQSRDSDLVGGQRPETQRTVDTSSTNQAQPNDSDQTLPVNSVSIDPIVLTTSNNSDMESVLAELAALRRTVESLTAGRSDLGVRGPRTQSNYAHQMAAQSTAPDVNNQLSNVTGFLSPSTSTSTVTGYSLQTAVGPPISTLPGVQGYSASTLPTQTINNGNPHICPSSSTTCTSNHLCNPTRSNLANDNADNMNGILNANTMHVQGYAPNPLSLAPMSGNNGVHSDSLPQIDIVSPSVRRDIIMGKDVNLASLLISGYKTDLETDHHLIKGGEIIPLKSTSDNRLSRNLLLSEFIMAFTTYKSIMCEAYPQRRSELDGYQRSIVEMAHKFGGTTFYEYHRLFSARAAAMLQNHNIKIDWSTKDTNIFCMTFAGHTTISCNRCGSKTHTSPFCPQVGEVTMNANTMNKLKYASIPSKSYGKYQDSKGRSRTIQDGKEICNNFNGEAGCFRFNCNYLHACSLCKKRTHGVSNCQAANNPPKNNFQSQVLSQPKSNKIISKTGTITN